MCDNSKEQKLATIICQLLSDPEQSEKLVEAAEDDKVWEQLSKEGLGEIRKSINDLAGNEKDMEQRVSEILEEGHLYWWSGVYEVQAPDWMKDKKIKVTGQEDHIQIDTNEINIVFSSGKYSWTYQEKNFEVIFYKEYKEDGSLANTWMKGKVQEEDFSAKLLMDTFNGISEQIVVSEWNALFGVIGSLVLVKEIFDLCSKKKREESEAAHKMQETIAELRTIQTRQVERNIREDLRCELNKSSEIVNDEINKKLNSSIDQKLQQLERGKWENDARARQVLKEQSKEYEKIIRDTIGKQINIYIEQILNRETKGLEFEQEQKNDIRTKISGEIQTQIYEQLSKEYLDALIDLRIKNYQCTKTQEDIEELTKDLTRKREDAKLMSEEIKKLQQEVKKEKQDLEKAQEKTMKEEEMEKRKKQLEEQMRELKKKKEENEKKATEIQEKKKRKSELEQKKEKADQTWEMCKKKKLYI